MSVFTRFRKAREKRANNAEEVIELWRKHSSLIRSSENYEERNLVLEQVFIAACELHESSVAESCIDFLKTQYPHSLRVQRLFAVLLESREEYDLALCAYDYLLQNDEADSFALKRRICVLLNQHKIHDAIASLVEYTQKFQSDKEAWIYLSDAYLEKLNLAYAAFCMEEVLMHNPQNRFFILRYAELKYALGHYEIARAYFLYAYRVSPTKNSLKALYGVLLSCRNIVFKTRSDTESVKLLTWARKRIETILISKASLCPLLVSQSFDILGC